MKPILSCFRSLSPWLLATTVLLTDARAAESSSPILSAERLWLPPSQEHLLPVLQRAVEMALSDPDCGQVLYGSLNEFRTGRGEPALTILCQQDARTTFNLVYRVSEVRATMAESTTTTASGDGEDNLDALRRLLMSDEELRRQPTSGASGQDSSAADEAGGEEQDERSLELDLDDLMRDRRRPSDDPPELF
ncbi:MAG: hypothetical protein ACQETO_11325 [Pseudomonadota bacterium]